MSEKPPVNVYSLSSEQANTLKGCVGLPRELRVIILRRFAQEHGVEALVGLFAEFIGLSVSATENCKEFTELLMVIEGLSHPHRSDLPNMPTIFGALLGVDLAKKAAPAFSKRKQPCMGCAFRLGTPANQSGITTCDADWAMAESEKFMCHEELDAIGNPTRLCIGFAEARKGQ